MNSDVTLEEFMALELERLARFAEIVRAGWASNDPAQPADWRERACRSLGTVYPGEAPIQLKQEWEAAIA